MSIHLERMLEPVEVVDHINNDSMDDRIENYQIITQQENMAKASPGITTVRLFCPVCGINFERPRRQTHLVKGGNPTCCSRSCGGKAGQQRRNS